MGPYHLAVTPHVLACALCTPATHAPTSPGTVIAYIAIGAIIATVLTVRAKRAKASGRPPEPMTDTSPFLISLIAGRNIPAYTAKVSAITPRGVHVHQTRCCARGHQSPQQAVTHANMIKSRIERTGR